MTTHRYQYGDITIRGTPLIHRYVTDFTERSYEYPSNTILAVSSSPFVIPSPINVDQVDPIPNIYDAQQEYVISIFEEYDVARINGEKSVRSDAKYIGEGGPYSFAVIREIATKLHIPVNNSKRATVSSILEYYRRFITDR
jgi:hypothetical protein